jgi:two-component system chemotaxis response regulator CheB
VRVIRRWPRTRQPPPAVELPRLKPAVEIKLIAIGASTGGPVVLQTILSRLPKQLTIPVVIVQHISAGFVRGLAEWLHGVTDQPVKVAGDGEKLLAGWVYLAPDDCQMQVQHGERIACLPAEPENGLRPSVSFLFRSVAAIYGSSAVGVLLTGMGKDGAAELREMRDRGALTMAQDKESSVIFGMPGEAIKCEAAMHVLSPEAIGDALAALLVRNGNRGPTPS